MFNIAAMAVIMLAACQKENVTPQGNNSKINLPSNKEKENGAARATWFDNGKQPGIDGVDYGCKGEPKNCGATTVVTGQCINSVYDAINNGSNSQIISTFALYYNDLSKFIDESDLDGVINGGFNVSLRGRNDNETKYLIFTDKGVITNVYPTKN
jgi:hypothetical protein